MRKELPVPASTRPSGVTVVTGAAGMIGSQLVCALAQRGHRIVACDAVLREERADYLANIAIEEWLRPDELCSWLGQRADDVSAVVHMGAISDTTERSIDRLIAHNTAFTMDLWQLACEHGWRFLYASSAATYGGGENGFVDDCDPAYLDRLRPLNLYGSSKHVADCQIVAQWHGGGQTPPVWAGFKFFNVYGPNEEHKGAMRSLVRKIAPTILRGQPVRLFRSHNPDYADGEQLRDFIYVKDAIRPVLHALDLDRLAGLFNVGTGEARSFLDLARATYAALGREPQIEYIDMPESIRAQYQYFTQANVTRVRAAGLHEIQFTLETGVSDYVAELVHGPLGMTDAYA